jgi:hypothetical protein
MYRSSHIPSVLIGIEYRNCCRTLDDYLLFAGANSIKADLNICNLWTGQFKNVIVYEFQLIKRKDIKSL